MPARAFRAQRTLRRSGCGLLPAKPPRAAAVPDRQRRTGALLASPKERESRPQPLACSPGIDAKRRVPRKRRETRLERPEDGYTLAGRACEATRRQRIAHAGAAVNAEEIRKLFYRNRLAHLERRCETHGRGENSLAPTRPHTACHKGLQNGRGENRQAVPTFAATQTTQVLGERFLRHLRIILISDKKL